ncbi:MAG: NAD(P)/FAD-dependent oxidoreductase [Myxococcota bacterium]
MSGREAERQSVIVIGGGFGGLAAAKALRDTPVTVGVVDKQNHHVFQPLLYQVATASLSPAEISAPIRAPLRSFKNCNVVLAEAVGVDVKTRTVLFEQGKAKYDYLVLAAGARHDYFGNDDWETWAPGLKTLGDATEIRRRMLLAFEAAEHEADAASRRAALTFVIVGGGPTGVELAGAIKEIATNTLPAEYRNVDTSTTRVVLVEGSDRILGSFPDGLSYRTQRDLERLGVEVILGTRVTKVTKDCVYMGDVSIETRNAIWAAGVRGSPLGKSLGVPCDRSGRVLVQQDLSIPGHPEVFVIGDMAAAEWDHTQDPDGARRQVPGVAQAAIQMGTYVGERIRSEVKGDSTPASRPPFRYRDKGSMAIIGKNRAVAAIGRARLGGFTAWLLWAVVHVAFIVGFRNRLRVLMGWFMNWLMSSRDARLIIGNSKPDIRLPYGPGFKPNLSSNDEQ